MGLHVFTVGSTGYGRDIQSRTLGYILQYHRAQQSLISFQKERTLQINNSLHDSGQRTPTLFHSLDKALCFFYLLAGILQSFPFRPTHLGTPGIHLVKDFHERRADTQLRYVAFIERKGNPPIVIGLYGKVRHNLLVIMSYHLAHGTSRTRIELLQISL